MFTFVCRCWWLALGLLLFSPGAWAQFSPAQQAQFQQRMRAFRFDHRFWEAPPDSLRRVLATQRNDILRLRTLTHLLLVEPKEAEGKEALALMSRFNYPERGAWGKYIRHESIVWGKTANQAAIIDTLQSALTLFEDLGPVPQLALLGDLAGHYDELNQPEAKRAYFQRKLAYYERHGPTQNVALCLRVLASTYEARGDYNQAISHRLRAAELFRTFWRVFYYAELGLIGADYAKWGNSARALPYLRQAVAGPGLSPGRWRFFTIITAGIYQRQGDYAQALRTSTQALRPRTPRDTISAFQQALGLVPQAAALLALGRTAEAEPRLRKAQHLADSLHAPLRSSFGELELNATWARYYAATGQGARAEQAWLAAYRQARQQNMAPLRLDYLRGLAGFYQQRGQPGRAAPYALAALALADTLSTAQAATHIAQYELAQADRAQNQRIARLRETQLLEAARTRRQRLLLFATLAGLALLAGVGFVLWRANRRQQQANEQLNQLNEAVTGQKHDLQAQRDALDASLGELRTTQAQLIQKEKMASLGELTAGIAHEIQNPLNFVNNFSEVSSELVEELEEEQQRPSRDAALEAELLGDLKQNLVKITQHGRRAAGIVKGMLEHSSTSAGEREPMDLNRLCNEYLRLAYQGLRAKDKTFNAALSTDFGTDLPVVTVVGADVGRVLLNLFTNAFYAVRQRQQQGEPGYQPQVGVRTLVLNRQVQIQVSDNGTGMSPAVQAKIFQPFFTTKPTGEGTGLGLSLSHDIIAQGHGGSLTVESQEGHGTTIYVGLPLNGTA
ncbi:MAG: ATP-binding protein [Janthinobacterium lividum]